MAAAPSGASGTPGGTTPPRQRVRVTSPRRDAARPGPIPPATTDIHEQTGLGEVYLDSLMRAQLRLSLTTLAGVVVVLGGLPLLFLAVPASRTAVVLGLPLPWLVLGILVYPVAVLACRLYVQRSERIEADFAHLVRGR